jgi:hypothetical protein
MQFCNDCGGVLNLFGHNTSGLCSSCIQHKKEPEPPLPAPPQDSNDLLAESILTVEKGKIILRSKEGWQLWSAPGDSQTKLQSILQSATLIYKIRKKRKKKP